MDPLVLEGLFRSDSHGRIHIVVLAARLLRICREHAEELRVDLDDVERQSSRRQLRHESRVLFEAIDGESVDADELRGLRSTFASAARQNGIPLAARAFAEGLELALGDRFLGSFAGQRQELRPHDPVPISFPAISIIRGALNGNPARRTTGYDELTRLRLAPADMRGIAVRMCWRLAGRSHLALDKTARFGVGITNRSMTEEFEWSSYEVAGERVFFSVRARAAVEQSRRVADVLSVATREHVDVLVLPELCLTPSLVEQVRQWRNQHSDGQIPLVVAGSCHLTSAEGSAGANEALIFAGAAELRHRKFLPYLLPEGEKPNRVDRAEHLAAAPKRLVVYWSGGWSFTVLVCKDVLDNAVQDLLRALGVQLVLVPAMSDSVQELTAAADRLASDPQAITVIANAGEVSGVFGQPRRLSPVLKTDARPLHLAVFLTDGRLELHPCAPQIGD